MVAVIANAVLRASRLVFVIAWHPFPIVAPVTLIGAEPATRQSPLHLIGVRTRIPLVLARAPLIHTLLAPAIPRTMTGQKVVAILVGPRSSLIAPLTLLDAFLRVFRVELTIPLLLLTTLRIQLPNASFLMAIEVPKQIAVLLVEIAVVLLVFPRSVDIIIGVRVLIPGPFFLPLLPLPPFGPLGPPPPL